MIEVQQLSDGTVRYLNVQDANADMILGGQAVPDGGTNPRYLSDNVIKMTLQLASSGGGMASWQNTFPVAIFVEGALLDVVTASSGACTVSVGTGASGTTLYSNLISGQSVAAVGQFGTRTTFTKVPAGQFITASMASGATAGLVGCLYIEFFPAT